MASNPPIEAVPPSQADPHARITAYVAQQRAFLPSFIAQGRRYIDHYLAREDAARRSEVASLQAGLSEGGTGPASSSQSRHSSSLRRPGVVARMQPRQTGKETGKQLDGGAQGGKRQKTTDIKTDEKKRKDSGHQPNKKTEREKSDVPDGQKERLIKVLKATNKANIMPPADDPPSKAKQTKRKVSKPVVVEEDSEPDRAARLEARKMRRRDKAAILKPKAPADPSSKKRKRDKQDKDRADGALDGSEGEGGEVKGEEKKRKRPAKVEKGMAMLKAFEADNIGGRNGRITVNPLRKGGLFGRRVTSTKKTVPLTVAARKARKPVADLPDEPVRLRSKTMKPKPEAPSASESSESSESADEQKDASVSASTKSSRCKVRKPARAEEQSKTKRSGGRDEAASEAQSPKSLPQEPAAHPRPRRQKRRLPTPESMDIEPRFKAPLTSEHAAEQEEDNDEEDAAQAEAMSWTATQPAENEEAESDDASLSAPAPQREEEIAQDDAPELETQPRPRTRLQHAQSPSDPLFEVQRLLGEEDDGRTSDAGGADPRAQQNDPRAQQNVRAGYRTSRRTDERHEHYGDENAASGWFQQAPQATAYEHVGYGQLEEQRYYEDHYAAEPAAAVIEFAQSETEDPLEIFGTRTDVVQRRLFSRRRA